MQFIYQPLTWAFFLVLLPLLIHLINMMRHRRVQWAAMDFLLASYRKHRKWVWLKQLILLLARMLAIALLVAMLANLVTREQWSRFFGGRAIHYYVLLDDSFSMGDRVGATTAFERAGRAVAELVRRWGGPESGPRKFTLLRFSQAARAVAASSDGGAAAESGAQGAFPAAEQLADFNAVLVDANLDMVLEEKRRGFELTQLAVGPGPALRIAAELANQSTDEYPVVYVVSDFRTDHWENPKETRQALAQLKKAAAEIHLVRCVQSERTNLAVTNLEPAEGTRAAGVPLFVDVTVKNFGPNPSEQVQLNVRTIRYANPTAGDDPANFEGQSDQLPTVLIESIAPGQSQSRRVQVFFPLAGQHVVEAALPDDTLAVDNRRWCVVDFPAEVPVLVIDGEPAQRDAYFLTSVFEPGQRAKTGIRPIVQPPAFLRDTTAEDLARYRTVYLLNIDRLDGAAITKLSHYVQRGGGLALFLGPGTNPDFYNQWYAGGNGLFPVPLDREDLLGPNLTSGPDLIVTDHPLFRVLLGQRNPFAQGIRVDQYLRAGKGWNPPDESTIRVLAQLRNGQPLVVERQVGDGRVVAWLTTLAPLWNNWARQPSFIVVALELNAYLEKAQRTEPSRMVGTPIDLSLGADQYRQDTQFVVPASPAGQRRVIRRAARPGQKDKSASLQVALGGDIAGMRGIGETDRSGVYEAWPVRLDGQADVRRFALNVDTRESELALVAPSELRAKLQPVRVEVHDPEEIDSLSPAMPAGFAWSQVLLIALVGLLLGEQLLAYSASYHPARGAAR